MNSVVQIIEPKDIFDGTKVGDFQKQIEQSVESGVDSVLVDFRDVTFMDSSGLGGLVKAFKTLTAANVEFFICSINEQVRILFELTSMDKYFSILRDREDFSQRLDKST